MSRKIRKESPRATVYTVIYTIKLKTKCNKTGNVINSVRDEGQAVIFKDNGCAMKTIFNIKAQIHLQLRSEK